MSVFYPKAEYHPTENQKGRLLNLNHNIFVLKISTRINVTGKRQLRIASHRRCEVSWKNIWNGRLHSIYIYIYLNARLSTFGLDSRKKYSTCSTRHVVEYQSSEPHFSNSIWKQQKHMRISNGECLMSYVKPERNRKTTD